MTHNPPIPLDRIRTIAKQFHWMGEHMLRDRHIYLITDKAATLVSLTGGTP